MVFDSTNKPFEQWMKAKSEQKSGDGAKHVGYFKRLKHMGIQALQSISNTVKLSNKSSELVQSDTFIYVRRGALFPRSFEYETTFSEEFSPEDRITVDGVAVCIRVAAFAIEVTIEGEMASDRANALVRDIKGSVEADTGRACVVKCDE